jgi:hypothetical protein
MARRINVIIRELDTNETKNQMVNQTGKDLLELTGDNFQKQALKLIERTIHRVYGPNGAMMLTEVKNKGKNVGYHGFVGHKANWGGDDRPRLFNEAKRVVVSFETDEGAPVSLPVDPQSETSQ